MRNTWTRGSADPLVPRSADQPWQSGPFRLATKVSAPFSGSGTRIPQMRSPPENAPQRRTSLQDVARLAGVSAAAVSYVVTGRTSEVSARTSEKIELAIKELRYKRQRRGLSLKLNREFAIGLVVVDPNPSFLADPFTTQVATGLSKALMEPGFGLTVSGCSTHEDLARLMERPIGVDAYVIIASGSASDRERLYRLMGDVDLPLVVVQEDAPSGVRDACSVLQDDFGGAQILTRHLIERGTRHLLFAAPSCPWPAIERRERGIRAMLGDQGAFAKVECEEEDFDATASAIERYLESHPLPDAIMGANDQIAIAALRVLERRGTSVPEQVQVTGYNDFPFRNFIRPLLTTIRSAADEIGRSCAEAVLTRLDRGNFHERTIEHGVTLDIGGTTTPIIDPPVRASTPASKARRRPLAAKLPD